MKKKISTQNLVLLSLLVAIEVIVAVTPLGSIPIGPIVATVAHIPVIIAAVTLGVGGGTFMGFVFGLLSFLVWTFMPPNVITAFTFTPAFPPGNVWSLVICFVPRILLGFSTAVLFKIISKFDKKKYFAYTVSAVLGSIIHTILVLGGIYVFFGDKYAEAIGVAHDALIGLIMVTVTSNGVIEAILAAVLAVGIAKAVTAYQRKKAR